jgi:hypothetical protein
MMFQNDGSNQSSQTSGQAAFPPADWLGFDNP